MQIFLKSRGTDWSALFCASKPACSCIYRDGRCLTDSGMTQPAPVFFYIFSAAVRLRYSWQVHSCYGGKEDDLSYTFSSFCTGCIHHGSMGTSCVPHISLQYLNMQYAPSQRLLTNKKRITTKLCYHAYL